MHDDWWLNAINHYDSVNDQREKSPLKKQIIRHLVNEKKRFLNKPNVKIVCPSREMKLKVSRFLLNKNSNVFVIPNPVSSKVFYPLEGDKPNNVLLYAGGTQDPRKGYDLLLSTVNSMREKCEILVLGKEGMEVAGVNQQIIITGQEWINSESEMNVIYNQSSMTMVPSRQEAFGQVASESLMTGTPVTCFEVGGLKDIVKNELNGFLIEDFDTTRMAECLDTFLRSNNFDSKAISTDASLRFSEEAVAASYLAIL
jgi:glycosyltransferase involved in cell wall biosynthesis